MGYIMDYIKNDVIEEKRLINSMIKDNVPMSRIKEVTERSKREIEAILAFPDNPSQNELYAIQAVWREGATRKYLKELKEREIERLPFDPSERPVSVTSSCSISC